MTTITHAFTVLSAYTAGESLHTHTDTHRHTHSHTHKHSRSTLQSLLIIDTSPCQMKQEATLFSDWWSLMSLCSFLLLLPLSACFIISVQRRAHPPPHPPVPTLYLILLLILDSLNKTQIKTDNEESFPLRHLQLLWLLFCVCVGCVCVFRVEVAVSAILFFESCFISCQTKQLYCIEPWPIQCVCVLGCVCLCVSQWFFFFLLVPECLRGAKMLWNVMLLGETPASI